MTDTSRLNRLLERARSRAEAELAPLTTVYRQALVALAENSADTFQTITASTWQRPPEGAVMRALDAVAASVVVAQSNLHKRILRVVTGDPLARLGIAWDVSHPLSRELLAQAGARTGERLGTAAQPVLRKVIETAYEQGLSVPDTASLIRSELTAAAEWQAEMLARTDLNSLANGGSVIAARLAGVPYKTWEATLDDRTRPEHSDAHGQTVPVGQTFQVGGEPLDYPGDPAGSDAMVANCRCTVTYGDSLTDTEPTLTAGGTMTAASIAQTTKWVSDLAFEGDATTDGRYILPRALSPRELPLTLMAMTETADGHDGAFVAGRIDTISRRSVDIDGDQLPDGVVSMRGAGVFDMGGENGSEIARLVSEDILRGVSIDMGILDWCFRDPATGELIEPDEMTDDQWERAFFGELQYAVKKAELLAATVCPTPAFANAKIALAASADGYRRVLRVWAQFKTEPQGQVADTFVRTRPLVAAAAPASPPREWFETQEMPGKTPLTITPEGRVFGHIATWDTCHTGIAQVCTTPPKSASGYSYFHVAELELDGGGSVAVGKLMLASKGGKHADIAASWKNAAQHYDDTSMVAAYLRATDGRHGIWVAGALNPRLTDDRVRELRTLPPSGDWRAVNGRLELICALAVPVPGFPIPRAEAALVAAADELTFSALIASSGAIASSPEVTRALAAAGLIPVEDDPDIRARVLVARAEGGVDGLLQLATEGATQ